MEAPLIFRLVPILVIVGVVLTFLVTIGMFVGVWKNRRKFEQAEDLIERRLRSAIDDDDGNELGPVACAFCGSMNPAGARCASCGAKNRTDGE